MSDESDESAPSGTELEPRQARFCEEYIKDLNGTRAAIRAGYSADTARQQASRLLTHVNIQRRVQELIDARSERTQIDAEYVLDIVRDTIDRCRQAVQVMEFVNGEWVPTGEWKFEHAGVLKGCELIGRHIRMFPTTHEVSGPGGKAIEVRDLSRLSNEELDAELAARGVPVKPEGAT